MADNEIPDEVKDQHVVNAVDARAQASQGGYSFMRSEFRRAKPTQDHPQGEVFEIPHKDLFDIDQQERWDDLQDEFDKYLREPDFYGPSTVDDDGNTVPGRLLARGQVRYPHKWAEDGEKDGEQHKAGDRVRPSYPERLAIVLWGEDGAKRARAGGINLNEIEVIWSKQFQEMQKRLRDDSKSDSRGDDVASAPNRNRS